MSESGGELCTVTAMPERGLGATGCTDERRVRTRPSIGSLVDVNAGTVTSGIAPDGVAAVRLALNDGGTMTVRPENNAFLAETPVDFETITFEWTDGRRTVAVDLRPGRIPRWRAWRDAPRATSAGSARRSATG